MPKTNKFVNSNSKNGEYSAHIKNNLVPRLKNYARSVNTTCIDVVNQALEKYLNEQERQLYEQMDKSDLIDLLLKR